MARGYLCGAIFCAPRHQRLRRPRSAPGPPQRQPAWPQRRTVLSYYLSIAVMVPTRQDPRPELARRMTLTSCGPGPCPPHRSGP